MFSNKKKFFLFFFILKYVPLPCSYSTLHAFKQWKYFLFLSGVCLKQTDVKLYSTAGFSCYVLNESQPKYSYVSALTTIAYLAESAQFKALLNSNIITTHNITYLYICEYMWVCTCVWKRKIGCYIIRKLLREQYCQKKKGWLG